VVRKEGWTNDDGLENESDDSYQEPYTMAAKKISSSFVLRLVVGKEQRELLLKSEHHFSRVFPMEAKSLLEYLGALHSRTTSATGIGLPL